MTNPTNWPNPERPGVPMFPEQDGIHLINMGAMIGMFWSATHQHYSRVKDWQRGMSPADMSDFEYCGPCLTPTQISEMLAAERERCVQAAASAQVPADGWGGPINDGGADRNEGIEDAIAAICNLGAAP